MHHFRIFVRRWQKYIEKLVTPCVLSNFMSKSCEKCLWTAILLGSDALF